jgi:NADPH-dependent 2,4-dienoyl-CoA reductase/sulfur reductase-like enzyme
MRGHSVVVFEKSDKVGGQLYEAVVPKHKQNLKQLIPYLKRQLQYNKIEVMFNKEATAENVLAEKPDVVITATGVLPVIPKIPGIESSNVMLVSDVLKGAQTGKNVAIIGG